MKTIDLMTVAIPVFILMGVGIGLSIYEFKKEIKKLDKKNKRKKSS
jgi:hypothetical protein